MKNPVFKKLITAILFLALVVPSISGCTSASKGSIVLPEKTGVPCSRALIIPVGQTLDASTLTKKNITVRDEKGRYADIEISMGSDGKSVIVLPKTAYDSNTIYTLSIKGTVKNSKGKYIGEDIKMKFTTSSAAGLAEDLPVVGTLENLKKIMEESAKNNEGIYGGMVLDGRVMFTASAEKSTSNSAQDLSGAVQNSDYSKTNIQVEGVDEADVVKTDGNYIYQVNNRKVIIVKAAPAEKMELISTLTFEDKNFYPMEIYIDDNHLVVIGSSFIETKPDASGKPEKSTGSSTNKKVSILPRYYGMNTTKVFVYDTKDKWNPKETRQVEIEGSYLSSRKIGSKLYLVSNKYAYYWLMDQENTNATPLYRDSVSSSKFQSIDCGKIRYFPGAVQDNYMIISSMDISNNEEIKIETYLGAGQNIYVSNENLYAAVTKYNIQPLKKENTTSGSKFQDPVSSVNPSTTVYKFALNDGNVKFEAKGEVPGTILNQYSMDEYNKYFRIATTSGQAWGMAESTSKNNIYVLDNAMNLAGKIEDIAPGEKIYSVRFMGERGYLVTFETVDPLFVIGFSDLEKPSILGQLKIPGYSNYLHPYDENHIIGFGKDAISLPIKDGGGKIAQRDMAFYLGMKIAIFDVTDVNNPVEMFSTKIGDRGTDSELLYNSKALLFSREKNLLAFPVNLCELKEGRNTINKDSGYPEYGELTFQGAYIYSIDLKKGFTLKGRITHISDDAFTNQEKIWNEANNFIERILYINDTLYTLSKGKIKASDMKSLNKISEITIPQDTVN